MDRHEAALESGFAVAPVTLAGLHMTLRARMVVVAARFSMESKTGRKSPTVCDGWLPPKIDADVENFPFLIVRPKAGTDTSEGADQNAVAGFMIIAGTYSDTDDGFFDVLNLIDAIRADLELEPVIAGTAYEQIGPLTWEIPEQQSRPQWLGTVSTNWQLPRPRRAPTEEG